MTIISCDYIFSAPNQYNFMIFNCKIYGKELISLYRNRLQRDKERDISEKIALGMPNPGVGGSRETQFDQRLFNQSKVSNLFPLNSYW